MVVVHNCRGALSKLEDVIQDLCMDNGRVPDVILLQETNISNENVGQVDIPQGWSAVHSSSPRGHMKGVMTLLRDGSPMGVARYVESVLDMSNDDMDLLIIEVRGVLIANTYIHVNSVSSRMETLQDVTDLLSDAMIKHPGAHVIEGGDYNSRHHNETLCENMEALGLTVVLPKSGIPVPTHAKGGVLDWLFVSEGIAAGDLQVMRRGEDHFILKSCVSVPMSIDNAPKAISFNWRKLQDIKACEEKFEDMMKDVLESAKGASLTDFRSRLINEVLPKHLGTRKVKGSSLSRTWYEKDIVLARQVYRKACRDYYNDRTPEHQNEMRIAHTAYQRAMRKRRRQAKSELARKVAFCHSSIYRLTAPKKGRRGQNKCIPNLEALLDFWTDQFDHEDPLTEDWWKSMTEEAGLGTAGISEVKFTVEQVREAISQIGSRKAPGDDDIRVDLFKGASDELVQEIARMFGELANMEDALPTWMKQSVGKLLYKQKGARRDPSNYRIIVMAPLFAKIYEKMLDNWGRSLIAEGVLKIENEQGGFRAKRATHDQIFLLESLRDAQIKRKEKMYCAVLDLRKAFDTVDHKKFLVLMRKQGAPEDWILSLSKLLTDRQLKLFDALVSLKVGTVQGSPISPLLFILFIDPLIEKLKALGKGINLVTEEEEQCLINCLLFADDTCILTSSLEDLKEMLAVCVSWAAEFGMSFNALKSELIQLAGKIPKRRPVVKLNGENVPWVKAIKYLGVEIREGRRKRHAAPMPKMWKAYHRVKAALDPTLPIPLRDQLLLMQADILSIALYPAAVVKMDYKTIDRFVNRILCRIVGRSQRWTSATFLRAELGVPSSRFLADARALTYYWHLAREVWFCDLLPKLEGSGPLARIQKLAEGYQLELGNVHDKSYETWKSEVQDQVMTNAEQQMTQDLQERGYPFGAEHKLRMRNFVRKGGPDARYGICFRWERIRRGDKRFSGQDVDRTCSVCEKQHIAHPCGCFQDIMTGCDTMVASKHWDLRWRAVEAVAKEISGVALTQEIPAWLKPHLQVAFDELSWPNQTDETIQLVLRVMARIGKSWKRSGKVMNEEGGGVS